MNWLRRLVHHWLGRDRYHDQAEQVNIRGLRMDLLSKQVQVMDRRGSKR